MNNFIIRIVLTRLQIILTVFALILLTGCAGPYKNVSPLPPTSYQVIRHTSGEACGFLGVFVYSIYFVPIMLNSRVERAYETALASVPGATSLINVQIRDDWYWWLVGTTRCTTISGDAVKEIKS